MELNILIGPALAAVVAFVGLSNFCLSIRFRKQDLERQEKEKEDSLSPFGRFVANTS
jgi:hypothetical protein